MRKYFRFSLYLSIAVCFSSIFAGAYEDFFAALERDDAGTVQQLLRRGFDPNSRDEKGQVALYRALRAGSLKSAELLLAHPQIEVDASNESDETPLMMATLRGQLDMAQRLVGKGARISKSGWSPLHYAATGPEPRLVAWMLEQGAPIDARSPNGSTPLMMAARYGPEASARLLLLRGATPGLRNDLGLSAADFARDGGRKALASDLAAAVR